MSLKTPIHEPPRHLRPRKLNGDSMIHSPDGYFAQDDLVRTWKHISDPAGIRNRGPVSHIDHSTLHNVVEEEDPSDPHAWRPPTQYDSRGPCPALGALSNHNYLPRNGRNITIPQMVYAIQEVYGGSWAYSWLITVVSYVILRLAGVGKGWLNPTIDLEDLGVHGVLEHDGSLTHLDVGEEEQPETPPTSSSRLSHSPAISATSTAVSVSRMQLNYAVTPSPTLQSLLWDMFLGIVSRLPIISYFFRSRTHVRARARPSRKLINQLLSESASGTHFTFADAARARLRRDACTRPIPQRHIRQFALGELAMSIDILGENGQVDLETFRTWLEDERLPPNWKPNHVQGVWRTHNAAKKVQAMMRRLTVYRSRNREGRSLVYE